MSETYLRETMEGLINKLLAQTMWDKSNVLFHSNLKKVFLPTAKKKKLKYSILGLQKQDINLKRNGFQELMQFYGRRYQQISGHFPSVS